MPVSLQVGKWKETFYTLYTCIKDNKGHLPLFVLFSYFKGHFEKHKKHKTFMQRFLCQKQDQSQVNSAATPMRSHTYLLFQWRLLRLLVMTVNSASNPKVIQICNLFAYIQCVSLVVKWASSSVQTVDWFHYFCRGLKAHNFKRYLVTIFHCCFQSECPILTILCFPPPQGWKEPIQEPMTSGACFI